MADEPHTLTEAREGLVCCWVLKAHVIPHLDTKEYPNQGDHEVEPVIMRYLGNTL